MDAIIDQIVQSPAISKAMLLGLGLLIVGIARGFYKVVTKNYKSIMKEFRLFNYKIEAIDTALEHSLKNGYANARNQKFQELKDNDNFIND